MADNKEKADAGDKTTSQKEEVPSKNETASSSEQATSASAPTEDPSSKGKPTPEIIAQVLQKLQLAQSASENQPSVPRSESQARHREYKFWNTQPVPKISESITEFVNEPIDPSEDIEKVSQTAVPLPEGFIWVDVDINDDKELSDLYTLLYENYVEDDDQMFRFNYSKAFLNWALKPPGWKTEWWCGVRTAPKPGQDKPGKLWAFVSAVPARVNIYDKNIQCVDINFLCVHKKLRSKRMTPVMIREITRRVNLKGIWQALYTAGVFIPKPISTARYFHRSIDCKKLIECGFSGLGKNQTISRVCKLNRLPDEIKLTGLRAMVKKDVKNVHELLNNYFKKFDLTPAFSEDEVAHWFLPIDDVVQSFVLERNDPTSKKKKIIAFTSFYCLPSTVMNHPKHKEIRAAYSFYNVVTEDVTLIQLMQDALITARNNGFDVFNALDLMENKEFIKELKFGPGDGNLHYYLFNWRCPDMTQDRIAVVLQ